MSGSEDANFDDEAEPKAEKEVVNPEPNVKKKKKKKKKGKAVEIGDDATVSYWTLKFNYFFLAF